jgi:hypothetical protein
VAWADMGVGAWVSRASSWTGLQIFQQLPRVGSGRKIMGRDARVDLAHQLAVRVSPAHAAWQDGGVDPGRLGEGAASARTT